MFRRMVGLVCTVGLLVRLVRRLAFSRGQQVRHFSFLGLWDHSARLQWSHDSRQTHAGNSPGNSSHTPPDLQALERGRRHFGACGGHSQDGASPYCRSGQASDGSPPGTRSAALQGQVQSPHRWSGQAQACLTAAAGGARDRGERFGTQRGGRFAAGQAAAGTRRQGPFWRGLKRTRRVRQLRKAGAHTGKLTLTGSNAGVLWGSEVLGFTPTQLQSIRVDAAKATYWLSRGQNADGSLGRHPRPRHHAGRAARLTGRAQSPQAAVVRSNGRSGHLRAHALSPGLERAVSEAPHDPRRHQDRPPGSCAQNGGLLGGPGIPSVV